MAKTRMLCPFSGELCKECPVYRGRHYYLCFCQKYRGCLSKPRKTPNTSRIGSNGKFEMPSVIRAVSAFDPFDIAFKENRKED
jgi:hypothetical protein